MTARYSQLTYTSFDCPGAAGGWRIKHTSGDLSEDDTEFLLSGVRTVLRPVQPLPAYPAPEQIDAAPRRLAYRYNPTGMGAYWHSVTAGTDSTGRPGNVFTHALLNRAPGADGLRPIQWWRSPHWLRPYGASAVGAAALPERPPAPAAQVSKDSVIDFALDTEVWRVGTLLGLLDAVAAALDGGPTVILATPTTDTAAQWIGLVSYLTSAECAAALNFSTFERADELASAARTRQHLSAIPLPDAAALHDANAIVIDDSVTLSLGELGATPHRTATGQPIAVTAWSVLAQEALVDPATARRVLDDIDHRTAPPGAHATQPAWPLAAVIAADPGFADAHDEARTVLAADPRPAHVDRAPRPAPTLRSN